jgi:hypothetical protein
MVEGLIGPPPESGEPQRPHQHRRDRHHRDVDEPDHRRAQHHAVEPSVPVRRRPHQHRGTHRMPEREKRRRTVRQHDFLHEGFEIDVVLGKAAHMALAAVAQPPLGQALPAPIQGRHGKSARAQIADQLEILLDELGPALKNADGALAAGRRLPARIPERHPVGRLQHGGGHAFGRRVLGY